MPAAERLESVLEELRVQPSPAQLESLRAYLDVLEHWNRAMNLTALEGREMARRLVAEPFWAADRLSPSGRYLDIGSGNGSPAIPWHVQADFTAVEMVESRRRRASFLRQACRQLALRRARVHASRFEGLVSELPAPDWITLQGVRLDSGLIGVVGRLCPNVARLAWFTSRTDPPIPPDDSLSVPGSNRRVLIFTVGARTSPGTDRPQDSR